jgi:hypothetical protein
MILLGAPGALAVHFRLQDGSASPAALPSNRDCDAAPGHMQTLATQVIGAAQARSHIPQLALSCVGSTQTPGAAPHRICPGGQVHTLATQLAPEPQTVPQAPQLVGLTVRSTQPSTGQSVLLASQAQALATQLCPAIVQAVPHIPQFAGSVVRSVQVPAQSVAGAVHPHMPPAHTSLAVQAMPHMPQLAGSFDGLEQVPLHGLSPIAHTHTLLRQVLLPQSAAERQGSPRAQPEHTPPPQSVPVSVPFFSPSAHDVGTQLCIVSQTSGMVQSGVALHPMHVPASGPIGSAQTPCFMPSEHGRTVVLTI